MSGISCLARYSAPLTNTAGAVEANHNWLGTTPPGIGARTSGFIDEKNRAAVSSDAAHVFGVLTRPLQVVLWIWLCTAAVLLVAGLWLLLAGRLNARHRDGNRVNGIVMAGRVALVAACWPVVVLGCVIGGVRTRLLDSSRRLVAAGRDAVVVPDVESYGQLERNTRAMNRNQRGQVDYGVPQTAPFWVGQRIRNTHAGHGVVISVQASDIADPRGSLPGGRWWEVVVEFDQPYIPRPKAGRVRPVRTWSWNVLADRYGRCSRTSLLRAG